MNTTVTYLHDLDFLKGLAIMAVVLYHAGWCKSGYLGVDVFFVINGYLVVPKLMKEISEGRFRYWHFLEKKLFRLLPLVLMVSAVVLLIGYIGMLPGDYRYLNEEVVASSVFMNNVLQAITTQNYWAAIYHKILMHNWFLGVLFQFYIVFPLLMLLFRKQMEACLVVLTLVSLLLYLSPIDTIGDKYYLLHYRFFEFTIGGVIAKKSFRNTGLVGNIALIGVLLLIFFGAFTVGERAMPYNLVGGTNTIRESFLPRELILLLTVLFAVLFVIGNKQDSWLSSFAQRSKFFSPLGRMSLSIFLWHQPLFAFYRYFYADELSWSVLVCIIAVTMLISVSTYYQIEKRIQVNKLSRLSLVLSFFAVNAFAIRMYQQGGVVRDVPELDIRKGKADPTAFEHYTDRIYRYDREFSADNSKRKILVIGNSFARDFANILLESSICDSIQLSYHYGIDNCPLSRVRHSDRIYFFGWKHQVPDIVWKNLKSGTDIWGIGTKNHGTSNGIFYKNRCRKDYLSQRTSILQDFYAVDRLMKQEWKDKYVDLLSLTMRDDSTVSVFTPDGHFITYDGKHLTPAGTRFYSELLFGVSERNGL